MKKDLWMSSAAVVIGALRVKMLHLPYIIKFYAGQISPILFCGVYLNNICVVITNSSS